MRKVHNNVVELFLGAARGYPQNIAIVEGRKSITYESLMISVKQTAAYFQSKGINKGDRIMIFVPMSIDLYRIVLALFYIGAVAVFVDEWVSKKRLELCSSIAKCKGFIGSTKIRVLSWFSKELRTIPIHLNYRKTSLTHVSMASLDAVHSALITFTTGSTGTPKAADRTHEFLTAQFDILKEKINPKPSDVDMPVLPIVLFLNLGVGCTSVIAPYKSSKPSTINPAQIISLIKRSKVNRITASPYFVKRIAEYLIVSQMQLSTLQQIFTGGAPVFPLEASLYDKAFDKAEVQIIYGSTEAEPISSISAKELISQRSLLSRGLPVGKVHPKTKLKIIKCTDKNVSKCLEEDLNDLELGPSEIGEIIVAGDHVLKKYFDNPMAFASNKIVTKSDIWHRTGDSGFLQNGQLFLTGRKKQLIEYNGTYVSPFIVENLLQYSTNFSAGTLLKHNGKLIICLETSITNKSSLKESIAEISFPFDKVELFKNLPRDPRHHSKIDYAKLEIELSKRK